MKPLPKGYWLGAIATAILIHLIAATALLWQPANATKGAAIHAGTGGIEISLGPAGGAPGGAQPIEPDENVNKETPPQETSADTPKPQEPEPVVESETVVEPEPDSEPEPVVKPEPVKHTEPVLAKQVAPKKHKKNKAHKKPKPATQGASGLSGNRDQQASGNGDNTAGGGLAGDTSDYMASLQAWLERHKQYPRLARRMRQEGTALLYFVVSPNGEVLNYELRQSSGHQHLDSEVIAMIERAQPLPAMPASMGQKELELIIPVEFFLR